MLKVIFFMIILFNFKTFNTLASTLTVNNSGSENEYKKAYFAGGCFWCMEESFDKVKGVIKSISGYSGGHTKNPTYKEVIYKDTGHVEAIAVYYDPKLTSYKELLQAFWKNIDPFDAAGQFCDKGKSYRSVAFYQNMKQKKLIDKSITRIEKKFNNKKIVTLVWEFEKFYPAEDYHQDYYQNNFLRYLAYKSGCQREEILNKIWN
ncbi:peptide-methionine (S)-S-oxide reductase MsrA [Pelagibacteraceae bacterium]|nr:peptide-methionine (S)-S-oxide reductase MsrA [Pelagibacteraceae bacterium]|tara:strand:- start:914 stop:1528 length:615 start_codon:yes stop_codon:yes gene_type:complete